ncbi:uncharacterized protein LOC117116587 [Anneissia japonica]|uniref:uncharacterized protein LOC117116587 n=1 Tax=Anneissia japonica TaxID=1529436 RepID=UPI0014257CE4|nr:uncharacterized protein LOC117116587 [Anneissia japonica]
MKMTGKDPVQLLRYMQDASSQLTNEIQQLRSGAYRKLYQQTRSFIDALQRSPQAQTTMYGPSVRTITEVRQCYEHSKILDADRPTHFTSVLELFLDLVDHLQMLAGRATDWIGEPVMELTVHPKQEELCSKISDELRFWIQFTDEENDFTELHKHKTLEEFRGLNSGEVPVWGAVVNLVPVLLKSAEIIADQQTKWSSITGRLGMGIYSQQCKDSAEQNGDGGSRGSSGRSSAGSSGKSSNKKKPKKTYADQVDQRNKGKMSLHERPPWKPSSTIPHNLFPKLHIHLSDPSKNF